MGQSEFEIPKVSFIIPSYNVAGYIGRCLDSVLNQTYNNIEIVIVDSSSDNTGDIVSGYVSKYGNRKIRLLHQESKGPAAARNFGIRNSVGEFIAFIDADDTLERESTERRIRKFNETQNCGLVYSNAFILREDEVHDVTFKDIVNGFCEGNAFSKLIINNYICTSTVLAPRKIVESAGLFDEELKNAEDYGLWLKISAKGYAIGYVDQKLTNYRIRKGSLSEDNLKNTEYLIALFNKLKRESDSFSAADRSLIESNVKRYHSDYFIIRAKNEIRCENYDAAIRNYLRICKLKRFDPKYYLVLLLLKIYPGLLRKTLLKRKGHRGV